MAASLVEGTATQRKTRGGGGEISDGEWKESNARPNDLLSGLRLVLPVWNGRWRERKRRKEGEGRRREGGGRGKGEGGLHRSQVSTCLKVAVGKWQPEGGHTRQSGNEHGPD